MINKKRDNPAALTNFWICLFRKAIGAFSILFLCAFGSYAQSNAHEKSKFAIIDPAYSPDTLSPKTSVIENAPSWIYGHSELECWRLQLYQQRKDAAKLLVGYPGVFHQPFTDCSFKLGFEGGQTVKKINFRAIGFGKVYINGAYTYSFPESDSSHTIKLSNTTQIKEIRFDIIGKSGPPALLIKNGILSTSNKHWQWKAANTQWETAYHHFQNSEGLPPHKLDAPTVTLKPVSSRHNLYDFGRELLGYILIKSDDKPIINAGESEEEALDIRNGILEQSLDIESISGNVWKTKSPLALRYLYVPNSHPENISCDAIFSPLAYKGAFACSDSTLTRIWMNSAYTLRLCMHDFLLDGIKRDRLPWAGDMAMSLWVNAYSFYAPEFVRRSLVALGRAGISNKNINGIIDYSLWWVIAQDQYQLYFNDMPHLTNEWGRIKDALGVLSSHCDSNGFLIPKGDDWLFIDWVEQEKWTALQILWYWAQKSGAKLAHRVGDSEAEKYWANNFQELGANLKEAAWCTKKQVWLSKNDMDSEETRHPNFLSIASGLTNLEEGAGIKALLEGEKVKPVGTPYMEGFEMIALAQLSGTNSMLGLVNGYWGGMLDRGATTFWEAYNPKGSKENQYSFYERPYGKSLCHAWSSGPAYFLPSELFGLKPLEDGWKRFSLDPDIGCLSWASVCLPTKYGNIKVDIENNNIQIAIPAGTIMEWEGKSFDGPQTIKDKLD